MTSETIQDRPEIGKSTTFDGVTTNYHDIGSGDPILLVHGSGPGVTSWANWRLNMPVFAEEFRVIAPDMLGFGYSDSIGAITDKRVWTDQLVRLLDELGLERVSMVGNSFGGGVTLAFMIAHPDRVHRAVLMGAAGLEFPLTPALDFVWGYEPSREAMHASLKMLAWDQSRLTDDLIDSRYQASIRPGAHEPYRATFGGPDRQAGINMLASREEDIAALPHEVLILHGKADQVIPQEVSLRLGNLIEHSDVRFFGECGHWVQIERMASFNRAVSEFFKHGLKW
ncbi:MULTISPECIES: alpha/beta fold hydrolase [Sphingopyxis]|jgi:2-hydroxymuconate-semialdehyde hydrolase|uniref:alpha/beta fold hydrolase n=2 Tax=Sphingomonadaceae TaxID=41297 RepID=UPI00073767E3|nr:MULTISPECIES: alpha/beta hydrolase [Sphingopyxis]KTE22755.1 2-hydroxy-6-oxo-2,4-heptadienoate hydrolase [Sphingopyxis sp. H050]KTE40414.1 2-hydroxy-6-oxo-2,4-heptadienoate hydrolase [Sphingopyxis sp. HIX]KTE85090.1 2-hydroxy-6-oxo-2,4-heptadienoate hydrolase [Sphingopyxis sp. HXXIV]